MKTFYQISEYSRDNYAHMTIMLYVGKNLEDASQIGDITFLKNITELDSLWFGLEYHLAYHVNAKKILQLAKIAKTIEDNTEWRCQPTEVIHLLDGEEVFTFQGRTIKVSDKGKYFYKIMRNDEHYSYGCFANDTVAQKHVNKMLHYNYTLGDRLLIA